MCLIEQGLARFKKKSFISSLYHIILPTQALKSPNAFLDRHFVRSSVICELKDMSIFPISFRTYVSLWRSRVKEKRLIHQLRTWYPHQNCFILRGAYNPPDLGFGIWKMYACNNHTSCWLFTGVYSCNCTYVWSVVDVRSSFWFYFA